MILSDDGRDGISVQERAFTGHIDTTGVLSGIAKIPDDVRSFTLSADRAASEFNISLELQEELVAAGVHSRWRGRTRYFDRADMHNISLGLDSGSSTRRVLRQWVRELELPYGESVSYRVEYLTQCPKRGHPGVCTFSFLEPGLTRAEVLSENQKTRVRHSSILTLSRKWPALPQVVREIIDITQEISFAILPDSLRGNVEFVQRAKMADCSGVAKILASEASSRGVIARCSYGRALSPPFTSGHWWAEFLIDGIWVPVDPVLIDALLDWGLMDKNRWSRYESIGSILWRMGSFRPAWALHNGRPFYNTKLLVYRKGQ